MSPVRKHLRRYGLALLGAAALAGCSSDGTDNGNPGTISLSVSPSSGSVQQGAQTTTTATLTRGGDFTGTVSLTVTGAPTGVTAAVSNVQTTGTTTTATVTIDVALTTTPGVYSIVVHGTGTGVTEATATYTLTVTAAPVPSFTLGLSVSALTILQGASTPTTTVNIGRTNFTGSVTLSVEGLPTGVTAAFAPANPQTGTSAVLTLTVPATAVIGTSNLVVRGVATGLTDQTAPLSLTIVAPPTPSFTLSLTPAALTIAQGASTPTTTVNIARVNFTGGVTLSVLNLPTGVTAAFTPANPQTGNSAVLTLTVAANAPTGTFPNLSVQGTGTAGTVATPLSLTITTPAPAPSFTLALTPATLSIAQGASTPTTTVAITRVNFTGDIALSVLNLPTGVTAAFTPANPQTGNSAVLTLTVAANAPTGTFTNLSVQGVGTAGTVATPLSLTITAAAPTPSFTLALTPATLSIAQGASTPTTTVTITRVNFTGGITLSVLNLPTGVTAAFAPANPNTGNSAVLTLTVAANAPTGTFTNLSVQGVGTAGTVTTALSLTITTPAPVGNFTLSTTPATSTSVTQGANANVTVNINRTGGNVSSVALTSTSTLPAGMTLTFVPSSTTTNSSVLTITTTGATPVGATAIVIRGNATGLAEQTVNLTVNVTAPGGGSGNVTVTFANCPVALKAVWLAFMDGTAGTWTAVTGLADVYKFNITQSKGSFAYVLLGTGTSQIIVQHMTQAELTGAILDFCGTVTPNTRVANGTVSNLPATNLAQISFGGGFASAFANGPFQITNARTGSFDLVGYAGQLGSVSATDRVFIKRGENPAAGGNFSVPVNFTDATLSAQVATASATLQGLVGGETTLNSSMNFFTQGAACVAAPLYGIGPAAASFSVFGVPASLRVGTDMHSISIIAANGTTSFRFLTENFLDVVARAASPFVLPAQLPAPVVTDAGGPYKRPQAVVTGVPAEFNLSHSLSYTDQTSTGKSGAISATQGWVGGPNFTLVLPNFAGVGTFNNAWAPATGDALQWSLSSIGGTFTGVCTAGQRSVIASRSGNL